MAFDQKQYNKDYTKEKYASFKVRIPKSKKEVINALAANTGKSINRLFVDAVEKMHHVDLTIIESELGQSE